LKFFVFTIVTRVSPTI